MDKFLEKQNLKLNEEEAKSLKIPITADKIEAVIKKLLTHKSPGPDGFMGEFYKAFKGELISIIHRLLDFKKFKKMADSQTLFTKPTTS